MKFFISLTPTARSALADLERDHSQAARFKSVVKSLQLLADNPKHPGLQIHKYYSICGPQGQEVFEAYAQQNTPAAYRLFFYYGPARGQIIVFAITPHP